MSIITNFLKLIKPEKNDYVDVEEHISNNYDKIDTWARDLVINDLENGGVDKALSANQGLILDNKDVGIMGGRDGKFPLTAATKGNIYLLESTQKYYICINDYDGIQISVPNANFEELSVYTNRSKLDNLFEIIYEVPNLVFVRYGNIVVGNGGVSELMRDFPDYKLTFDPKFLPTTPSYCSVQSDNSNTVGELVIYKNGVYNLANPHGSFNITWFIKI